MDHPAAPVSLVVRQGGPHIVEEAGQLRAIPIIQSASRRTILVTVGVKPHLGQQLCSSGAAGGTDLRDAVGDASEIHGAPSVGCLDARTMRG